MHLNSEEKVEIFEKYGKGKTDTGTMMSDGFDPYLSSWSPYHGAIYAVTESVAKIVAAGGDGTINRIVNFCLR